MPRPATIALENKDGTITQVDITWSSVDPGPLGEFIVEHYSDVNKLKSLLEQGDICTLGKEIGEPHDINDMTSIDKGWTRFYARDGGATNHSAIVFSTLDEYIKEVHEGEHHYFYRSVGDEHVWYYCRENDGLVLLSPVIAKTEIKMPVFSSTGPQI